MLVYYLLVIIPLIFYLLGRIKGKRFNKVVISVFFIFLIALLSLRSVKCGTDLVLYFPNFNRLPYVPWESIFLLSSKGEHLFNILGKIVSIISGDFQVFLTVIALLSLVPIAKKYKKDSNDALLTIALFLTVAPFSMFFSGLRQSCAMGLVILSFIFIEKKQILRFIIVIVIASLFHDSALFCLVLYPIYYAKITKKWLYVIVPIMVMIFVFNEQIFSFVLQFASSTYQERYSQITSTGAYSILILLVALAVYCFIFPDKEKIDQKFIGLRNILLLSICVQCFAPINPIIMRINYYNLLTVPILIPMVITYAKPANRKMIKLIEMAMCIFLIAYFFYNAYTGEDILNVFPYIPFWE